MGQIKNKSHDKAVGSRISEMRQKAGFKSLIDFAERYDFDYQTLRSIESGHLTINTATLKWFAETLKVSSDYLLGLTDIQTPDVKEREVIDKYGLTAKSLESLSETFESSQRIVTPNMKTLPICKKALKALNAIVPRNPLFLSIFGLIYDVLFTEPDEPINSDNFKDGYGLGVWKGDEHLIGCHIDAEYYRDIQFIMLYRLLNMRRDQLLLEAKNIPT